MPDTAVQTALPLTFECPDCLDTLACDENSQCDNCERCLDRASGRDCCLCYTCDACETRVNPDDSDRCSNCDNCGDCCECSTCPNCDTLTSDAPCSTCDNCDNCCDCWRCRNCRTMINPNGDDGYRCECCDNCSSCCSCYSCDHCGERFESLCQDCDDNNRCSDCCRCSDDDGNDEEAVSTRETRNGSRQTGVFTDGSLVFHNAVTYDVNRSGRHISLELEVARDNGNGSANVRPVAERWFDSIVRDGSIPTCGYEINLNPTNGDLFLKHVGEVCSGLKESNAVVDKSCGMHCHVDVRDFTTEQLFNLCRIYTLVEDALFTVVSRSRRKQQDDGYCRLVGARYSFDSQEDFLDRLETRLYGYVNHPDKKKKYADARYYALNLHSFFYRQTVEFRHHQGTTNPTKAANWGRLCVAIVDAAATLTTAEVDAMPSESWPCLMALLPDNQMREFYAMRRSMLA